MRGVIDMFENFYWHYQQKGNFLLSKAYDFWNEIRDHETAHENAAQKFYKFC